MDLTSLTTYFILFLSLVDLSFQVCYKAKIKNGRVRLRRRGKMAIYRCKRGFSLFGNNGAVCISGKWSHPPPKCIAPGCPAIIATEGIIATPSFNSAKMTFSCEESFKLEGPKAIFCDQVSWDQAPPVCLPKSSLLACDFEQSDLCGWSQSTNDDFDWIRHSGQTPSGHTGPSADHTFGSGKNGYYMYIETSSPRKAGDAARLDSPLYLPEQSDQCFDLWYHMKGPDGDNVVGTLDIFVKPESETLSDITPSFQDDGNKGDIWLRADIIVPPMTDKFQIVVIAKRLESYVSDIAIDDVRLYNCSEEIVTDEATSPDTTTEVMTTTTTRRTPTATTATITIKRRSTTTQRPTTTHTTRPTTVSSTKMSTTTRRPTTPVKTTPQPQTTTTMRPTVTSRRTRPQRTTTAGSTRRRTTSAPSTTRKSTPSTRRPRTTTRPSRTTPRRTRRPWTRRPWTRRPTTTRRPKSRKTTRRPRTSSSATTFSPATTPTQRRGDMGNVSRMSTSTRSAKPTTDSGFNVTNTNYIPVTTSPDIFNRSGEANSSEVVDKISEQLPDKKASNTKNSEFLPLAIGIAGGVLFVIIVIAILVTVWAKKKRRQEVEPYEELEPITKAVSKTSLNLNLVSDYNIVDD